jgi:hypothetical protein
LLYQHTRCTTVTATYYPHAVRFAIWAVLLLAAASARGQVELQPWAFAVGHASETLQTVAAGMPPPAAMVVLPHRLLTPNTALWYARELDLTGIRTLRVMADDGAQVFVAGQRLAQRGTDFALPHQLAGSHRVIVRVLNNAMSGGLQSVALLTEGAMEPRDMALRAWPGYKAVESAEFRTDMPAPEQPCRFTAWADSQGGWNTFAALVTLMAKDTSHFSVGIGDLTNNGSEAVQWRAFVATVEPLAEMTHVVPVPGNHDYDGFYADLIAPPYLRLFRSGSHQSWFAWSCGPARFVAVDVNREFPLGISPGSLQYQWLVREAHSAAWRDALWRVLLVHQPPWSRTWIGYDGDAATRSVLSLLSAERSANIVMAGHSHAYESLPRSLHGAPIHVFVVGGAGGSLEDPQPDVLSGAGDRYSVRHHYVRVHATVDTFTAQAVGLDGRVFDVTRLVTPAKERPLRAARVSPRSR